MKAFVLILFTVSLTTFSQEQTQGKRQGHRKPPPEAIEACSGLSDGDQCTFDLPNRNTIEGTCFRPTQELSLACRPSRR